MQFLFYIAPEAKDNVKNIASDLFIGLFEIAVNKAKKQAEEIAKQKMNDLNAIDLEQAVKIIAGSARSMGIEVKE